MNTMMMTEESISAVCLLHSASAEELAKFKTDLETLRTRRTPL
jgi:hypothetical protein